MSDLIDRKAFKEKYCVFGWIEEISEEVFDAFPTVDAEPIRHAKWEWFEEWSESNTDHFAECEDCGWRCGKCKTPIEKSVGGYWDDVDIVPELNYCPNCGAKMDKER